jgi:hypothetical protein
MTSWSLDLAASRARRRGHRSLNNGTRRRVLAVQAWEGVQSPQSRMTKTMRNQQSCPWDVLGPIQH